MSLCRIGGNDEDNVVSIDWEFLQTRRATWNKIFKFQSEASNGYFILI